MYSLSLVIPTLNEEKVIGKTLGQFPPDFCEKYHIEIIVSDGGSSDKTVEIAAQHAHKVVTHTESRRQTISEGRNKGAENASGDILIFLDADVVIGDKQRFFRHIQVFGSSHHVFMTGNVHIYPEEQTFTDIFWHHGINFFAFMMQRTRIPTARGELQIIKKDIFAKIGGYREDLVASEDFDLGIRARKHGILWYNHRLTVYESPRRFRKYGYRHVLFLWWKNAVKMLLQGKSSSTEWEQVR